jgi:hypothetical protein
MFKAEIKAVGQHWQPLNHQIWRTPLTSQTKSSILRSAPFCWCMYFTPCLPAQLRRRDHSLLSVALKRAWGQQCCMTAWLL